MGKRRSIPANFGRNAARQAQRKYLAGKMTQSERVEKNREAAGHVISMCFLVALNTRYGIGEGRLERVTDAANAEMERFIVNRKAVGMERAKRKLTEELGELLPGGFILPVTKPPKSNKDWAMLGEQREAAEIVVKCYAMGAHKALGFGAGRVQGTVAETEQVFREFGAWAESGDYFGYAALARKLECIFHTAVDVDESGAVEPIFSETLD
ncbi:MAG: hypothetical protein Q4F81_03460 [Eubacteriales bacterium]|nr:hypothetical protein [Eubacteriales bacterium]